MSNSPKQKTRPSGLRLVAAIVAGLTVCTALALWVAYRQLGYTPQEILDYTEWRISDRPRIQLLAQPLIAQARDFFGLVPPKERLSRPFLVPPPPPLTIKERAETSGATAGAQVLRVGKDAEFASIAAAALAARDGDIVEIEAGEYYADVAVWSQKRLTIRGVGGNARLIAAGSSAEAKAIWVIRDGDFTIENIDFIGARVPDHNGAGIRFENGHLKIVNCLFWDNENGLLTTGGAEHRHARLEIERSEFAYNGAGDGQSHNLYVGRIASLKVTASYFHHANVGHLLKSRAAENEILYNRLTDESGGRSSYELEFPNGGKAIVIGNIIQQNAETENSTIVAYGREGYAWPTNDLYLANNTIVNDHPHGGAFLRAADGKIRIISSNNLLVGLGKYHASASIESINDVWATREIFEQPFRYDYRLTADAQKLSYRAPSDLAVGGEKRPQAERQYQHPRNSIPLPGGPVHPGAIQVSMPDN